jgi:hypothetical protein
MNSFEFQGEFAEAVFLVMCDPYEWAVSNLDP